MNLNFHQFKLFDRATGGVEHSSLDNPANAGNLIADWLAEVLGGNVRKSPAAAADAEETPEVRHAETH